MKSQMYVKLRVKHEDGTKLLDGEDVALVNLFLQSLIIAILSIENIFAPLSVILLNSLHLSTFSVVVSFVMFCFSL
jgi:hypothetical protein